VELPVRTVLSSFLLVVGSHLRKIPSSPRREICGERTGIPPCPESGRTRNRIPLPTQWAAGTCCKWLLPWIPRITSRPGFALFRGRQICWSLLFSYSCH